MYSKILKVAVLLAILLFPLGCKKEESTILKGTIIDFYTNEPLQGAAIFIMKWHKTDEQYQLFKILSSDANGNFEFVEEDNLDFYIGEIHKQGYIVKHSNISNYTGKIKRGEINESIIPLVPFDSWLSLTVNKVSPGKSKIYLSVFSHILNSEIRASQGRVSLMKDELELTEGQTYTQFPLVASNEMLTIHWDFKPLTPWSPFSTPFRDSIFVTRGDTSAVTITY